MAHMTFEEFTNELMNLSPFYTMSTNQANWKLQAGQGDTTSKTLLYTLRATSCMTVREINMELVKNVHWDIITENTVVMVMERRMQ